MKQITFFLAAILLSLATLAQTPQAINYQAVARNADGEVIANQNITVKISILSGSAMGAAVYAERHDAITNGMGLFTLQIGNPTQVLSGNFETIDWGAANYFLKTEMDENGGFNFVYLGTSQLLSVPYALHAKTSETLTQPITETDPVWSAAIPNYYTKTNMQTSGSSQLHFGNLTNKPTTLAGYGITNAMNTSHAANGITTTNITNWNTSFGWGNHASAGYIFGSRTLTINGTTQDLSANRTWDVGTVTSVGMSLPNIFFVAGSPVTASGTLSATLASQSKNSVFASPNGSAGTPAFRNLTQGDIPNLPWSIISSGKPTTLLGYGITDAVNRTSNQTIAGSKTFTANVIVPTPVNPTDAATKAYVDELKQIIYEEFLEAGLNGIVKDVCGNTYSTIKIGTQVWMAENLKTTKYRDGSDITYLVNNTAWKNDTTGAYCYYGNVETYGALYNWLAVNKASGLCPTGWHVPKLTEWTTLTTYLGGGDWVVGGKLKETGTLHWLSPNDGATNETGFTGLPGGRRYDTAGVRLNSHGYFWSSTLGSFTTAVYYSLVYYDGSFLLGTDLKNYGHSVRCLRD